MNNDYNRFDSLVGGREVSNTPVASAIRVFAVCDSAIEREGLASMVATDARLQWVGCAGDAADALRLAPFARPRVVLLDSELRDVGVVQALEQLHQLLPQTVFVVLARLADAATVRRVTAVVRCAVVLKNTTAEALANSIEAAVGGQMRHAPEVEQALRDSHFEPAGRLTYRERELLGLLVRGLSNGDISTRMSIAVPTVKFHMTKIMSKLGVENRTAVVLLALRHNLVEVA